MSEIVYCKDCAYAEPNNLDSYHTVKLGMFCTRYKQNTAGIHGCDNGKPKAKTNADRIRAMADEEMAKYLSYIAECDHCPRGLDRECCVNEDACINRWLKWLKQEGE